MFLLFIPYEWITNYTYTMITIAKFLFQVEYLLVRTFLFFCAIHVDHELNQRCKVALTHATSVQVVF